MSNVIYFTPIKAKKVVTDGWDSLYQDNSLDNEITRIKSFVSDDERVEYIEKTVGIKETDGEGDDLLIYWRGNPGVAKDRCRVHLDILDTYELRTTLEDGKYDVIVNGLSSIYYKAVVEDGWIVLESLIQATEEFGTLYGRHDAYIEQVVTKPNKTIFVIAS